MDQELLRALDLVHRPLDCFGFRGNWFVSVPGIACTLHCYRSSNPRGLSIRFNGWLVLGLHRWQSNCHAGTVPGVSRQCARHRKHGSSTSLPAFHPAKSQHQPPKPASHHAPPHCRAAPCSVEQSQVNRIASLTHDSLIVTTNFRRCPSNWKPTEHVSATQGAASLNARADYMSAPRLGEGEVWV